MTCADVGAVVHRKGPRAHRVLQPEQRHRLRPPARMRHHLTHRNALQPPNLHFRSHLRAPSCSDHPVRRNQRACANETPARVEDVDDVNLRRIWERRGEGGRVVPPREDQRRALAAIRRGGDREFAADRIVNLPPGGRMRSAWASRGVHSTVGHLVAPGCMEWKQHSRR